MNLNPGRRETALRVLLMVALVAVASVAFRSRSAGSHASVWTWRWAASTLLLGVLAFAVMQLRGALHRNLPTSSTRAALAEILNAVACWIGAAVAAVTAARFFPDLFGGLAILVPTVASIALGAFFLIRALALYLYPPA